MLAFVLGVALGFVGSIPAAGPLAASIVDATLGGQPRRAFRLSIGGAVAECGWAGLAFYSVGRATLELGALVAGVRAVGAVVLVLVGVAMLRGARASPAASARPDSRGSDVVAGFSFVATNPAFLAVWTGFASFVFASKSLPRTPIAAILAGAFVGIVVWFWTLSGIVLRVRERMAPRVLERTRQMLAWVVIASGFWLGVSSARGFASFASSPW